MSFQSSRKARARRRAVTIAMASVVFIAAYIFLRSLGDEPEPPRILGTGGDTTGFNEEIGVFEEDTTGDIAITTADVIGDSAAPADTPRPQPTPDQPSRSPLALNNYAWLLHLAGEHEEAEYHLREVIRMAPRRAIAYANLGETLWKRGRNDEAVAMYRKFLELNTDPRRERIAEEKIAQITGS